MLPLKLHKFNFDSFYRPFTNKSCHICSFNINLQFYQNLVSCKDNQVFLPITPLSPCLLHIVAVLVTGISLVIIWLTSHWSQLICHRHRATLIGTYDSDLSQCPATSLVHQKCSYRSVGGQLDRGHWRDKLWYSP